MALSTSALSDVETHLKHASLNVVVVRYLIGSQSWSNATLPFVGDATQEKEARPHSSKIHKYLELLPFESIDVLHGGNVSRSMIIVNMC